MKALSSLLITESRIAAKIRVAYTIQICKTSKKFDTNTIDSQVVTVFMVSQ